MNQQFSLKFLISTMLFQTYMLSLRTTCRLFICQLRGLVIRAFACEMWYTRFDSQLGHTKDFKNGICSISCFTVQQLRVVQRVKKQSVDYTQ